MRFLGVDPSLRSTGYCYKDADENYVVGRIKSGSLRNAPRLSYVLGSFREIVEEASLQHTDFLSVGYEDYAMGIRGGRSFSIGELGGVLKLHLWASRVPIMLIPPTSLKMFATGKGNADKPDVIQAVVENYGVEVNNDDEADAVVAYHMAQARYLGARHYRGFRKKEAIMGTTYLEDF